MFIIFSLIISSPKEILIGMKSIIDSNNILLIDYMPISVSATFFNSGLISLISIFVLYKLRLRLNGLLISSIFLVLSFAFVGKNIINIIPFYIGTYVYCIIFNKNYKSVIAIAMMSTTLAPIVSALGFYGILISFVAAFLIPILAQHSIHFHSGYSLYNIGFAGGILSIAIYSQILAMNGQVLINRDIYQSYNYGIFLLFFIYFIFLIITGYLNSKHFKDDLKEVYKHSGRLVTDFVQKEGFYISIFNMGTLGLMCLILITIFNKMNGPILCAMLTVVGFGGFGKHLKNCIPVMLGVFISSLFFKIKPGMSIVLVTAMFSTTLSPIAGKFGFLSGVIVGIMHYTMNLHVGVLNGGINLYNNGLAAGLVASIYVPIIEAIKGGSILERTKKKSSKNDR